MGRRPRSQTFKPQPSPLRKTWGPDNADTTTEDEPTATESSDYMFTSDELDTPESDSDDGYESPYVDMLSGSESEVEDYNHPYGPIPPNAKVFIIGFTEDDVIVETRYFDENGNYFDENGNRIPDEGEEQTEDDEGEWVTTEESGEESDEQEEAEMESDDEEYEADDEDA